MIESFHIFLLAFSALFCINLIPLKEKKIFLFTVSIFTVFIISPTSFFFTLISIILINIKFLKSKFSLIIIIFLFSLLRVLSYEINYIDLSGLIFSILRLYNLTKLKSDFDFIGQLHYLFFLPLFFIGPIIQYQTFEKARFKINYKNLSKNFFKFFFGFFLVFIISNEMLSSYINLISTIHTENVIFKALIFQSIVILKFLKIYISFTGASDIAISTSRILNLNVMENFNRPWKAKSFSDFWSRWHISASNFVRQNIFYPLATRGFKPVYALYITFIIFGLWHDFTFGYIFWGIAHPTMIVLDKIIIQRFIKNNFIKNAIVLISISNISYVAFNY
jgi:D-alanyl-lipoteichoic acid acyltransferase DltB (MBOAT superfamily)